MSTFAHAPGALRLFVLSIVARLPLSMLSIALLVHVERLTGSFGAAGAVTAAYAVALGLVGPLLGQLVDRRGQTAVLLGAAALSAMLLGALAALPGDTPLPLLVALAAGLGAATPPLGACLRTLLPTILPDATAVRAAYAVDATATELAWVSGPPLVLGAGALLSTGAALVAAGLVLLTGTVAFAAQPASRGWRPDREAARRRGGSLRSPAMRTLVLLMIAVGTLFGAVEVGVTAATDAQGGAGGAAALLALWGAGSLGGGMLAVRWGAAAGGLGALGVVLAVLAGGHLLLLPAAGSLPAIGAVLVLGGAAIAPTYAIVYAMVEDAAPRGTVTEAFAWLATAVAIGASLGAAAGGPLADQGGAAAAFAFGAVAGVAALVVAATRARSLAPSRALATA